MTLSAQQLALLVDDIAPLILGGQIQKVWCAGPHALALSIRTPGQTHGLLISAEPDASRLHLIERKPEQPPSPTAFVMLLRKHLIGGRVRALTLLRSGDRVVRLDIDRRAAPSDDDTPPQHTPKALVAELFGRQGALLALDGPDDRILATLRHPRGDRDVRPGASYTPPAPPSASAPAQSTSKPDPLSLDALDGPQARSAHVAAHYAARAERAHADDAARDALRRLKRQRKALQRKIRAVEGDLERAEQAEGYKRLGELLQGAYGSPPARGATSVTVPDYYDPDLTPTPIALDPQLDLQGNIARYFKLYRRYHEALPTIEARLGDLWEAGERMDDACAQARALAWRATDGRLGAAPDADGAPLPDTPDAALDTLDALLTGLEADGLLLPPRLQARPRSGRQAIPALPYRTFTSRTGRTILVGKGNRDNDALSTHIARGRDLWLHAHDWAGAHVVVRLERNADVDHQTLLDAATLAAHYSKGRNDTVVDVTYTLAKNVRKPKGYPPGRVTVADANTLAVRIEPERLERLFATRTQAR